MHSTTEAKHSGMAVVMGTCLGVSLLLPFSSADAVQTEVLSVNFSVNFRLLCSCIAFGIWCNGQMNLDGSQVNFPSPSSPLCSWVTESEQENFLASADWEQIVSQLSWFLWVLSLFPTLTLLLTCRSCLGKAAFPRPLCSCQLHFLFDICTMMQAIRENNLHKPPTWGTGQT